MINCLVIAAMVTALVGCASPKPTESNTVSSFEWRGWSFGNLSRGRGFVSIVGLEEYVEREGLTGWLRLLEDDRLLPAHDSEWFPTNLRVCDAVGLAFERSYMAEYRIDPDSAAEHRQVHIDALVAVIQAWRAHHADGTQLPDFRSLRYP